MITRVRMSVEQRLEADIASWTREVEAARLEGRWSSKLQELDERLDAHFAQQPEWDAEELAEIAQMHAELAESA